MGYEGGVWRREWDSNPRYLAVNTLSKRAPSATRPSLQRVNRIASVGMIADRAPGLVLDATGALIAVATKA
jgi:hypothetical protein